MKQCGGWRNALSLAGPELFRISDGFKEFCEGRPTSYTSWVEQIRGRVWSPLGRLGHDCVMMISKPGYDVIADPPCHGLKLLAFAQASGRLRNERSQQR